MTNSRFKFRVWDKNHKCWISFEDDRESAALTFKIEESRYFCLPFSDNDVCEYSQSTGLYDCDGKEIWEGDYVQWEDYRGEIIFGIHQDSKFPGFHIKIEEVEEGSDRHQTYRHDKNYKLIRYFPNHVKIIGNRFENPELLENMK